MRKGNGMKWPWTKKPRTTLDILRELSCQIMTETYVESFEMIVPDRVFELFASQIPYERLSEGQLMEIKFNHSGKLCVKIKRA